MIDIVKSTKNHKGRPSEMNLTLIINDIPNNLEPQKPVVYRRSHNFHFK